MSAFEQELERRLAELEAHSLYRRLRRIDSAQGARILHQGRELLNFASNDYLGLANHPALKEAAQKAISDFGAGAGASRLVCGSLEPWHKLEEAIAQFKKTEAALAFSTGYAAAMGTICALVGKEDVVVLDKLVHASIVDAARLSGAAIRVFHHNDLDDLEAILKWTAGRPGQTLIITESLFSMDGDFAPLLPMVDLKHRHGAWLMVDEAHAMGVFGEHRRGCLDRDGLAGQVEIQMGTLGKAAGAAGGFIAGSRKLIDLLINRARSFIFSTSAVPASAAAARAGLGVIASEEGETRRGTLRERCIQFRRGLNQSIDDWSPIFPLLIGDETKALDAAKQFSEQGILAPAIRFPTVARGKARIRLTFSANHTESEIEQLLSVCPCPRSEQSGKASLPS